MLVHKRNRLLTIVVLSFILFHSFNCYAQLGTLRIKWAGVIDNGEGDNYPHGPTGNIHVLIYPVEFGCPGDQPSYSGYIGGNKIIKGPTSGKFWKDLGIANTFGGNDPVDEWLDGDAMQMNMPVYSWKYSNEEIILFIYESDPRKKNIPARSHDMLACLRISRQGTFNTIVLGDTYRQANDDAIINCRKRNITWQNGVWNGGLNRGIPKLFLLARTE